MIEINPLWDKVESDRLVDVGVVNGRKIRLVMVKDGAEATLLLRSDLDPESPPDVNENGAYMLPEELQGLGEITIHGVQIPVGELEVAVDPPVPGLNSAAVALIGTVSAEEAEHIFTSANGSDEPEGENQVVTDQHVQDIQDALDQEDVDSAIGQPEVEAPPEKEVQVDITPEERQRIKDEMRPHIETELEARLAPLIQDAIEAETQRRQSVRDTLLPELRAEVLADIMAERGGSEEAIVKAAVAEYFKANPEDGTFENGWDNA